MPQNDLYLTVLPLIHITNNPPVGYGLTEQTLTLFPDKEFATAFFKDEADAYIKTFKTYADTYLTGGHVTGYECIKETNEDGRVIVKVIQSVRE